MCIRSRSSSAFAGRCRRRAWRGSTATRLLSPKSWQAALTAIGAANAAVDDVFSGKADNVFVAARPPGHHAEKTTAMGFCLFNNAAIAARHAQRRHGAERVAIVDWDVHHGNGTQDIFWDDPSVLYCSTHQMPLLSRHRRQERDRRRQHRQRAAVARHRQRPLPRGVPRRASCRRSTISRPDLIIISAGFDAHHRDPLAEINLTEDDFDWATGKLMDRAARFSAAPSRQPARRRLRSAGAGLFGRRPCRAPDERMNHGRLSRMTKSRR